MQGDKTAYKSTISSVKIFNFLQKNLDWLRLVLKLVPLIFPVESASG